MKHIIISTRAAVFVTVFFLSCPIYASQHNKELLPEKLLEDLIFLFEKVEKIHPDIYGHTSQSLIDSLKQDVIYKLDKPMNSLDFARLIIPLVAALNDGHTKVDWPWKYRRDYLDNNGAIFPFDVMIRGGRIYVVNNYSADTTITTNAEILSLNGIPTKQLIKEMRRFISAELDHFRDVMIGERFGWHLWHVYGFEDIYDLEINQNRKTKVKRVNGVTLEELRAKRGPIEPKPNYRYYVINNNTIGVIEINEMTDNNKFKSLLDSAFKSINEQQIRHLIIDIRQNNGGNSDLANTLFNYITDKPYKLIEEVDIKVSRAIKRNFRQNTPLLVRPLFYTVLQFNPIARAFTFARPGKTLTYSPKISKPKNVEYKFDGDVYLLTGPVTFSSAIAIAAPFKCYNMGLVIGEETGGTLSGFTNLIDFELPNSGLQAQSSFMRYVHPCYDGKVRGVIPDVIITPTPKELQQGYDSVINYIIKKVNQ